MSEQLIALLQQQMTAQQNQHQEQMAILQEQNQNLLTARLHHILKEQTQHWHSAYHHLQHLIRHWSCGVTTGRGL